MAQNKYDGGAAIIGHVSWDDLKSENSDPTRYSLTFRHGLMSLDTRLLADKNCFAFQGNGVVVSSFGRICHWPDHPNSTLKNQNQAQMLAENFEPSLSFLPAMAGDFAFVVWDEKAEVLTLVRDHLGTRPLFYVQTDASVCFATDIESLLPYCEDPENLFAPQVETFVNGFQNEHPTRTQIAEIYAVPPATVVQFTNGQKTSRQYWDLSDVPKQKLADDQAYYDKGRKLLVQAITERIPDDVPLGLHISGGLDSSTIAAVTMEHCRDANIEKPVGVSWQPDPKPSEEMTYDQAFIAYCAEVFGIDVHGSGITEKDQIEYAEIDPCKTVLTSDLPLEFAAQNRVAQYERPLFLSGWGGDQGISCAGRSWKRSLAPLWFLRGYEFLRYGRRPKHTSYSRITKGLLQRAQKMGHATHSQNVRNSQIAMLTCGHVQNRMTCWSIYFAPRGVQYAFPFLDRRLLEFVLSVPDRLYVGTAGKRNFMRQVIKGVTPDHIRMRPDKDEPSRFADSIAASVDVAPILLDRLQHAKLTSRRLDHVNVEKIEADLQQVVNAKGHVSGKLMRALGLILNG